MNNYIKIIEPMLNLLKNIVKNKNLISSSSKL